MKFFNGKFFWITAILWLGFSFCSIQVFAKDSRSIFEKVEEYFEKTQKEIGQNDFPKAGTHLNDAYNYLFNLKASLPVGKSSKLLNQSLVQIKKVKNRLLAGSLVSKGEISRLSQTTNRNLSMYFCSRNAKIREGLIDDDIVRCNVPQCSTSKGVYHAIVRKKDLNACLPGTAPSIAYSLEA